MANKIRIIGGEWRSRLLHFDDVPGLRPTPARVRETLFNWLQYDVAGSRCLDLFAGSGALGFEAASRGAREVVQVESDAKACKNLRANASALGGDKNRIIESDVERFLAGRSEAFDLVFMDPPFAKNLAVKTCLLLEQNGWLAGYAKIYVETEVDLELIGMPDNWRMLKHKTAGEVAYRLFARAS
ncbi:16S rRNA (guanine(966)-N(2))-methyltransferase RsmD [Methylomicrobium sp. Wu6]|uniref:16S rRNA (guanine(966)-N(2))-methyltransferase RsmD n=1 Tax=Methylomicrobium sp. Wu6 TaxID=3107928 RepID=UPI002DD64E1D|nr:16S rRNA (guanine(966)-N(2))-methyltransferase RsmD [Methylomicrobium sp. Wu6]MEC4747557.1 16S rRNA (guanine(966)-N(2))-methyltransferase RsmD [Methylomicrobium sp. Wu6]